MPIVKCEICGLRTSRVGDTKRTFMAQFPLDEDQCKKWIKITGKEDLAYVPIEKLHQLKHICGKHFRPKDFKKKKTQLKRNAVPCIGIMAEPLSDDILSDFPLHLHKKAVEDQHLHIDATSPSIPQCSKDFAACIVQEHDYCKDTGIEDIHEPTWFAHQQRESFLLPICTMKLVVNSETQSRSSKSAVTKTRDEKTVNDKSLAGSAAAVPAPFAKKNTEKSHPCSALQFAEQQMPTAFHQLTNAHTQRRSKLSNADNEDECDLYGKLLAKKIKELPADERMLVMYEIDGIFIKKIQQRQETPSPSTPLPGSSVYILPEQPQSFDIF